jgi:hypothetical protein
MLVGNRGVFSFGGSKICAQKLPKSSQGMGRQRTATSWGRFDGVNQGLLLSIAVFAGLSDRAGPVWPRLGLLLGLGFDLSLTD